ncbi:hypothetical protein [Arthrobacter roseus]|uniref:hypothetical protein n=1 Tax=Arthrobacter roseus TaxID=136274 RepID=UPI001964D0DD|nr:hypothetical protein [Arthrobacter roseus]MBM7848944.1 hypothetical protein [Arthrobacter roseus]
MEWVIGFIVIVAIVAVVWWLLNRDSNRADSPDSLDHAPGTLQHGFSDVGQQVPVTFSNHDASTPSAGPGLGGKAAMARDEAAARRRTDDTERPHASGSSRVDHEPVNPNEPFIEENPTADTPAGHQDSGVEPVADNGSGDWDIDESETVVSRPGDEHTAGSTHRQDT